MESKFWQHDSSSSSNDDDGVDENKFIDSESDDETSKKPMATTGRWANMEDSSSDDEEKRVVRSTKDKRWDQLRQTIKAMKNYKTIEDFGELQSGFESLLRYIRKSKTIVDKEGVPPFFIRAIAELESYVTDRFLDKEGLKKMSKGKSISFNILRSKIRKGMEIYRPLVDEYHKNASNFEDDDDDDTLASQDSSSSEEEDSVNLSDTSGSHSSEFADDSDDEDFDSNDSQDYEKKDGDIKRVKFKKGVSRSNDDEEWEASDYENEVMDNSDDDAQQRVLKMWGKKEASEEKSKIKKIKKKTTRSNVVTKVHQETQSQQTTYGRGKSTPILVPGERVDAELLSKKLKEVISLRGRKGFDRSEQIRHLNELSAAAKQISSQCYMEILGHLISAHCDLLLGSFLSTPCTQWSLAFEEIHNALNLLRKDSDCYFSFLLADDDLYAPAEDNLNDLETQTLQPSMFSSTNGLKHQSNPTSSAVSKEAKARLDTSITLTRFLERIDDELMKFLQLTDIHSDDYKLGLHHTVDMVFILWKAYMYFLRKDHEECCCHIALRILEHIYYRSDTIASKMWEIIQKKLDPEDISLLKDAVECPSSIVTLLVKQNLKKSTCRNINVRFLLYVAYSHSLHGRYYQARDLLQSSNIQELASHCNIGTQVFLNRNLVQLGLAAFRLGLTNEAHAYLSEVCAMGRYRELLAQGLSNIPRGMEKNIEQERSEKRRILPYHMHIPSDLVEAVHNICAMLLEVPYMAENVQETVRKPIARNFRRLLEIYDRQMFTGPPENARECIMAATKALQKGDWTTCADHIMSLKFWDSFFDSDNVKKVITERIKQEALNTYLLMYSSMYVSMSTKQLAEMFNLSKTTVHSLVSKMVIHGLLSGSWDEASECILINRIERTPLQRFALQLTDKISQVVEQNETTLFYRNPRHILSQNIIREERQRRFDERWATSDRKTYADNNRLNNSIFNNNTHDYTMTSTRYIPGNPLVSRYQSITVGNTKRR
ncbi:uncharacterized protein LOC128884430 [Hylaeus volcanicus]|uniref:uncharacterized protein LOC128884430 n=1 Tax=Hylaeus volcanicus TaxID=313075 RepID=UPI0023B844B6|nr:uncharacterized protein LOC128884430 [Hylaeus volcanicus]